jgi:hypothetical protein
MTATLKAGPQVRRNEQSVPLAPQSFGRAKAAVRRATFNSPRKHQPRRKFFRVAAVIATAANHVSGLQHDAGPGRKSTRASVRSPPRQGQTPPLRKPLEPRRRPSLEEQERLRAGLGPVSEPTRSRVPAAGSSRRIQDAGQTARRDRRNVEPALHALCQRSQRSQTNDPIAPPDSSTLPVSLVRMSIAGG